MCMVSHGRKAPPGSVLTVSREQKCTRGKLPERRREKAIKLAIHRAYHCHGGADEIGAPAEQKDGATDVGRFEPRATYLKAARGQTQRPYTPPPPIL